MADMLQEEKFKSMVDSGMQGSHAFTLQNNCVRTSQKSCTVPITLAEKN